ncbi:MAG: NAD(P)H-hydrate dehydratase, partial [Gammaproteobacteria bacterium]
MALKFNFESLDNKLPKRDINSHKGNNGRVLIVAGSEGMGGAGILASEASLFSGSGLVSLFTHKSNVSASLERNPEIMVLGIDDCIEYSNNLDVLLIGPGLGSDKWSKLMSKYLDQVNKNICLVVDAGGLSFLKSTPLVLECKSTILTPHPGEAANLLDTT